MKIECPKCFTDVIPMANERCPACGELAASANQSGRTKVTVREGGPEGAHCVACGCPTSHQIQIKRKARNSNFDPNAGDRLATHPLAIVLNFFAGKFHQTVAVRIPICGACKRNGPPEPKYIDFERRTMTFVAHRALRDDLEKI